MPPAIPSETARERELFRYYQPDQAPQYGVNPDPAFADHSHVPHSSQDTVLTAFAQLGCLRLNAKRAMISLVDRDFEYILAEATQSMSLQSDTVHNLGDGMLAGNRTIAKSEGICAFAVDRFMDEIKQLRKSATNLDTPIVAKSFVIPDLAEDERFKLNAFGAAGSRLGFYAGFPITTRKDFIIGVISVIDDRYRGGLSPAEEDFLADLSTSIMAHLEMVRFKRQQYRAEGMVKGMGLFVAGKASLRNWWLHTGHRTRGGQGKHATQRGSSLQQKADEEYGTHHELGPKQFPPVENQAAGSNQDFAARSDVVKQWTRPLPPASETWRSLDLNTSKSASLEVSSPAGESVTASTESLDSKRSSKDFDDAADSLPNTNEIEAHDRVQESTIAKEIERTFARASNLIREATAVEGVLFLDAGLGNYEGSTSREDVRQKVPMAFRGKDERRTASSSDDDLQRAAIENVVSAPIISDGREGRVLRPSIQVLEKFCNIHGWSTRSQASLYGQRAAKSHASVPEPFLQRLLKSYPHGKIFNFDETGSMSSSEDDILNHDEESAICGDGRISARGKRRKTKQLRRSLEAKKILSIFPGSRSVAFMPLWDPHREKWFSGAFSWSLLPTRVFDVEEDLTYLVAFGNSIMAEVSRTNALIADQRKTDLISSISHELRSPLHGVLASAEILQGTKMDPLQTEMVSAIDTCGKTLLDVIDHVLDFTTLNNASKFERANRNKARDSYSANLKLQQTSGLSGIPKSTLDLAEATEEVVESILAGHRYTHGPTRASSDSLAATTIHSNDRSTGGSTVHFKNDSVMVILDLHWQPNWVIEVQAGAWRRIVMNLVANAMKFTDVGYVSISLRCDDVRSVKEGDQMSQVVLTVSDSGRGISEDFLRNRLFEPFGQEDNLREGVGLGLNNIHKIVQSLGGTIDFSSELGSGTKATVTARFKVPDTIVGAPLLSQRGQLISDLRMNTGKFRACLVGFDVLPNVTEVPTGILSLEAERKISLRGSLMRLLADWFGIEVSFAMSMPCVPADVYITTQEEFNSCSSETSFPKPPLPGTPGGGALIVIGSDSTLASTSKLNLLPNVVFLHEPCGPYKLAKALTVCLDPDRRSASQGEHNSDAERKFPVPDSSIPTESTSVGKSEEKELEPPKATSIPTRPRLNKSSTAERGPRQSTSNITSIGSRTRLAEHSSDFALSGLLPQEAARNPRILLVEDNKINLTVLVMFMRKLNHSFATAENGLEALEAYKTALTRFDVILMDISMPVMDGLTSMRLIRTFERTTKMTPSIIIVLTAAASTSSRQEALESGADIFLTKPVPLMELKEIVGQRKASI
ncbi:MAG: hypothetical protein M1818_002317 [Claussenomyces sp. TS43310]|nr:MAG: hypothetical protein M1818_002317 [Claussenomyces sp. TS43310]